MREILKFNNDWSFSKENTNFENINSLEFKPITIPHTWNNLDGQDGGNDYYRGTCWYRKNFDLTEEDLSKELYLEFEAVNASSDVYINNKLATHHDGGYSTFRIHLNALVHIGQNEIILSADNSANDRVYPQKADFTFYGGIYRDVNLIKTGISHFDLEYHGGQGIMVTPLVNENGSSTVTVKGFVKNPEGTDVVYEIINEGAVILSKTVSGTEATASFEIETPHLWHGVKDPHLYQLNAKIIKDNQILDNQEIKFGIRSYKVDPELGFILNGERYPLHGVSRHQDRKDLGWALTKKEHKEDMDLIYEVGANTIRLAHYQHNQYFYDLCDEYGMVIWAEIPYISMHMNNGRENVFSQMTELVVQNYNHPSIVCWGLSNEITMSGESEQLLQDHRDLNAYVKEMDPTRLTTIACVTMTSPSSELNRISDLVSYNHYYGWYAGKVSYNGPWIDKYHAKYPNICLGISEYGCEAVLKWHSDDPKQGDYSEEYQSYYHEEMLKTFATRPFLWSTHVWNMFDFAADARDEGGVKGMNNKGLVTYDRSTKKDSFFIYKAYWNEKEKFVHICSKRYEERATETINVTVYTNLDEVTLIHNGIDLGSKVAENHKVVFEVKLTEGKNTIDAISGEYKDCAVFTKVNEDSGKYRLNDGASGVTNWFEDNGKKLNFPEGYLNINTEICDYQTNDTMKAMIVFGLKVAGKKMKMSDVLNEDMLEILTMSVSRIFNLVGNMMKMDGSFLYDVNEVLNKIPQIYHPEQVADNYKDVVINGKTIKLNMPEGRLSLNSKIKEIVKVDYINELIKVLPKFDKTGKVKGFTRGLKFFILKQFRVTKILNIVKKDIPEEMLQDINGILNTIKK